MSNEDPVIVLDDDDDNDVEFIGTGTSNQGRVQHVPEKQQSKRGLPSVANGILKPTIHYSKLITQALITCSYRKATANQICDIIAGAQPYFKHCPPTWKNTIRHTLLRRKKFFLECGLNDNSEQVWGLNPIFEKFMITKWVPKYMQTMYLSQPTTSALPVTTNTVSSTTSHPVIVSCQSLRPESPIFVSSGKSEMVNYEDLIPETNCEDDEVSSNVGEPEFVLEDPEGVPVQNQQTNSEQSVVPWEPVVIVTDEVSSTSQNAAVSIGDGSATKDKPPDKSVRDIRDSASKAKSSGNEVFGKGHQKVTFTDFSLENLKCKQIRDDEIHYRLEFQKEHPSIEKFRLHCTVCDIHLGTSGVNIKPNVRFHNRLGVLVCTACYLDTSTPPYRSCQWCSQVTSVKYSCSTCSSLFCENCLKRNFGTQWYQRVFQKKGILDSPWTCLICDHKSIWPHRAIAYFLYRHYKDLRRQKLLQPPNKYQMLVKSDLSTCCKPNSGVGMAPLPSATSQTLIVDSQTPNQIYLTTPPAVTSVTVNTGTQYIHNVYNEFPNRNFVVVQAPTQNDNTIITSTLPRTVVHTQTSTSVSNSANSLTNSPNVLSQKFISHPDNQIVNQTKAPNASQQTVIKRPDNQFVTRLSNSSNVLSQNNHPDNLFGRNSTNFPNHQTVTNRSDNLKPPNVTSLANIQQMVNNQFRDQTSSVKDLNQSNQEKTFAQTNNRSDSQIVYNTESSGNERSLSFIVTTASRDEDTIIIPDETSVVLPNENCVIITNNEPLEVNSPEPSPAVKQTLTKRQKIERPMPKSKKQSLLRTVLMNESIESMKRHLMHRETETNSDVSISNKRCTETSNQADVSSKNTNDIAHHNVEEPILKSIIETATERLFELKKKQNLYPSACKNSAVEHNSQEGQVPELTSESTTTTTNIPKIKIRTLRELQDERIFNISEQNNTDTTTNIEKVQECNNELFRFAEDGIETFEEINVTSLKNGIIEACQTLVNTQRKLKELARVISWNLVYKKEKAKDLVNQFQSILKSCQIQFGVIDGNVKKEFSHMIPDNNMDNLIETFESTNEKYVTKKKPKRKKSKIHEKRKPPITVSNPFEQSLYDVEMRDESNFSQCSNQQPTTMFSDNQPSTNEQALTLKIIKAKRKRCLWNDRQRKRTKRRNRFQSVSYKKDGGVMKRRGRPPRPLRFEDTNEEFNLSYMHQNSEPDHRLQKRLREPVLPLRVSGRRHPSSEEYISQLISHSDSSLQYLYSFVRPCSVLLHRLDSRIVELLKMRAAKVL